jgi:hypothetical protein
MNRDDLLKVIAANEEFMSRTSSMDDLRNCVVQTKLLHAIVDALGTPGEQAARNALESWTKVYRTATSNRVSSDSQQ